MNCEFLINLTLTLSLFNSVISFSFRSAQLNDKWIERLHQQHFVPFKPLEITPGFLDALNAKKFDASQFEQMAAANLRNTPDSKLCVICGVVIEKDDLPGVLQRFFKGNVTNMMLGMASYDPKPSGWDDATPDQRLFCETVIYHILQNGCRVIGHCDPCPFLVQSVENSV
jgi:hypothetical protein